MNGKQNAIFFLGITLIIMVFWVHGYWTILKNGFTGGPGAPAPKLLVPQQGKNIPPIQGTKKCPAGYFYQNGQCVPEAF